jgi:hypothetical protein
MDTKKEKTEKAKKALSDNKEKPQLKPKQGKN